MVSVENSFVDLFITSYDLFDSQWGHLAYTWRLAITILLRFDTHFYCSPKSTEVALALLGAFKAPGPQRNSRY